MGERAYHRHTRLVDRQFQIGLAVRLILVLAALFAVGIALAFAPSIYVLATANDLKSLEPAASEFLMLHKRLWPAALLSFAGVFVYCLLFSHRVAGPVYRINAALRQMLRGDPPAEIRFRKGDYFQPTAELLAELSRKMRAGSGVAPAPGGPPGGDPPV